MSQASAWDHEAVARLRKLGGQEFVEKMIDTFLEHTPTRMEAVRTGAKSQDCEAIRQAVHSLKSSAGTIGAQPLRELCERIEVLAMAQKMTEITPVLPSLETTFSETVNHLQTMRKGGAA